MHPRRLQRGALSIALAGSLLVAGSASAKKLRFQGWTPLSDYVTAGLSEGGSFRLTVPTRAGETEVALHPVDVNAKDYHAEEAVQNGERRGRRRPALHTFAGSIEKAGGTHRVRHGRGGDFARLSREASGRVSGLMRVDGVLYDLAADPAAGDLVLQVNEVDPDELSKLLGACGTAVDEALAGDAVAAEASATSSDATGAPASAAAGALHEVELGTEADAPFVAQTGGVSEANARIASIVNAINGIYEFDLGLTLKVSFQRAWNGSDPYTSTDSQALLSQFRSNFLGHVSAATDDAVLFSGRDFDGSIVGRAWVSSACSDYRFGVNQFYQQNDSLTRLIAAHEMGHTLGASHDTVTGGIMAPSINPNVTWFSATSQQQIADYVAAVSCLAAVDVGGAPVLDPIGPQDAPENATLSLQLSATDPEGGAISWSALPLPIGASLSPSGLFQWTPPLDSVGCGGFVDHSVTFRATDPDGNSASETVVISVIDTPTGSPPVIDDPADRSALSDRPLSIPLSADRRGRRPRELRRGEPARRRRRLGRRHAHVDADLRPDRHARAELHRDGLHEQELGTERHDRGGVERAAPDEPHCRERRQGHRDRAGRTELRRQEGARLLRAEEGQGVRDHRHEPARARAEEEEGPARHGLAECDAGRRGVRQHAPLHVHAGALSRPWNASSTRAGRRSERAARAARACAGAARSISAAGSPARAAANRTCGP